MLKAWALLRLLTQRGPVGVWIFLLGSLMTLGFAPFGLWFVGVISLAGLWALVRAAQSPKQAATASFVWALGHTLTALYWLPWAFYKDAEGSWLAALGGGVPAMLGLAVFSTLGPVVAGWAGFQARAAHPRLGPLLGSAAWALVWVAVEFVKGLTPFGFPWLPVGAVWALSPTMMQAASLGGVWLLSLLVLAVAIVFSYPIRRRVWLGFVMLLVVALGGQWRLHTAPETPTLAERVRLVQPNIQSSHKWDPVKRWEFLQETLDTALESREQGVLAPATIVMPETAVAFFLDTDAMARQTVARRLPPATVLVTGTVRKEPAPGAYQPRFFNSLAVLTPEGKLTSSTDKHLLVPFGEFIPGRSLLDKLPLPLPLRTLSQSRLDYTAGTGAPLLQTPAGVAEGLICYEGIFPLYVLRHSKGARYLVNVTNDNWFTGTIALGQHAALARLRAVETGLPLIRVANTGLTEVIDSYGRKVATLPINTASRVDIALPPPAPATLLAKGLDLR